MLPCNILLRRIASKTLDLSSVENRSTFMNRGVVIQVRPQVNLIMPRSPLFAWRRERARSRSRLQFSRKYLWIAFSVRRAAGSDKMRNTHQSGLADPSKCAHKKTLRRELRWRVSIGTSLSNQLRSSRLQQVGKCPLVCRKHRRLHLPLKVVHGPAQPIVQANAV